MSVGRHFGICSIMQEFVGVCCSVGFRPSMWKLLCQAGVCSFGCHLKILFHLKRLDVEGPAAAAVDLSPWCPAFNNFQ